MYLLMWFASHLENGCTNRNINIFDMHAETYITFVLLVALLVCACGSITINGKTVENTVWTAIFQKAYYFASTLIFFRYLFSSLLPRLYSIFFFIFLYIYRMKIFVFFLFLICSASNKFISICLFHSLIVSE